MRNAKHHQHGGWLLGCGIALAVFVVLVCAGCLAVGLTWKRWASAGVVAVMKQAVDEADIPSDQKTQIKNRVDQLREDFVEGNLELEDFARIGEKLESSPLMYAGGALVVNQGYLQPSGLTAEEKQSGERALQRLARGMFEGTVTQSELQEALDPMAQTNAQGEWELREPEQVTDDQLRQVITLAQERADEAGVVDEAWTINFADEFDRLVNEALGLSP